MMRHMALSLLALSCASCAATPFAGDNAKAVAPPRKIVAERQFINNDAANIARLMHEFVDVTAVAGPRTNVVIITGDADKVSMAMDLGSRLESIPDFGGEGGPPFHMYSRPFKNVSAENLLPLLKRLSQAGYFDPSGLAPPIHPTFTADPRLNVLFFMCTEESGHSLSDQILTLLQELDQPSK